MFASRNQAFIMNTILQWDREVLVYLNNLGSQEWDALWLGITTIWYWSPLLILSLFLVYRSGGWKPLLRSFLSALFLGLFVLWSTARIKKYVGRLRPVNEPELDGLIREVAQAPDFSFFSGHASFSFVVAAVFFWYLKKEQPWMSAIWLISAMLISYSRIYLGLHYPLDVLSGAAFGFLLGTSSFLRSRRRLTKA